MDMFVFKLFGPKIDVHGLILYCSRGPHSSPRPRQKHIAAYASTAGTFVQATLCFLATIWQRPYGNVLFSNNLSMIRA